MKAKTISPVITLRKEALRTLDKILKEPATKQQKKSLSESIGTFAYYQDKWQKKR